MAKYIWHEELGEIVVPIHNRYEILLSEWVTPIHSKDLPEGQHVMSTVYQGYQWIKSQKD